MAQSSPDITVADAAARYLTSLSTEDRAAQQQELSRFMRWYGADRPMKRMRITEVDDYVAFVETSNADSALRLGPVRAFLAYANAQGLTSSNLAVHVRIRRTSSRKDNSAETREQPMLPSVQLTAQGYQEMQDELKTLISLRPQMSEAIRLAAADKDFRENAPLDAAREHQGQVEARIRELQAVLRMAQVVEEPEVAVAHVMLGSTVILRDLDEDEDVTYVLVDPNEADPRRGKLSIASPTGKAVLDRTEGEEVEVAAPAGIVRYRIMSVTRQ